MVEYTAPVFWGFFFLGALSLIVLRVREPGIERPFPVPLYPFTPILFCATCLYMLRASLAYTGKGAIVGLAVLFSGLIFILLDYLRLSRKGRSQ
jgi:amino acid transporter